MKRIFLFLFFLSTAFATIPDGYYDPASGLSGTELKSALHNIIDDHTVLSYTPGVWNAYQTTDLKANGKIWDMYSTYEYTFGTDQVSSDGYSGEGDKYNREHSWPSSYFNGKVYPMYSDVFHVYPTDAYVNQRRGNETYGETDTPTWTSSNGSKLGPAKSGLGYTGTVFEPINEYKGDFARTYFYMATRYYTEDGSWLNWAMADGVELKAWAVEMLIQWHIDDSVSTKEINRNNAVHVLQHNRNPFIDHPEYVSYIWGDETPEEVIAPTALAASNINSTSFTANWNVVTSATGYKLYVSEDINFISYLNGYSPKSLSITSETITGLSPETSYYYKLKAYTASEESDFSNVIMLQTLEGNSSDTSTSYTETFANFPETGSSYCDGSFTGQDGSSWQYVQCRGDLLIDNETPCLGKSRTPTASITSGNITGGISSLQFQFKQAYSTDVLLDLYVNDIKITTVTTSSETGVIKESGNIDVNISGDAVIKFIQQTSESGQVCVDNISWVSYPLTAVQAVPETFYIGNAYPNPFNPNCVLPLELSNEASVNIKLFDILGNMQKTIIDGSLSAGYHLIPINGSGLSAGIYFIRALVGTDIAVRKVVIVK